MAKKSKNYSIIIVSDATASSKEFGISGNFLKKAILAAAVLLIVFGFIIFDYLTISFDREKLQRLENENEQKQGTIDNLTKTVKDLERDLYALAEFEKRIKVSSGLTSPFALKEVGAGGGETIVNVSGSEMPQLDGGTANPPLQDNILNRVGELKEQSSKLLDSLKFVNSVIDKKKTMLAHTPMVWPTRGYVTDGFGWRTHPITGLRDNHQGVDIATQLGNPVTATANGTVLLAGRQGYYGNLVVIDHHFGYETLYGHLASIAVKEGQKITRGQVVGYVGSTGRSNAPHLHYEIRFNNKAVNPMNFVWD